MLVMKNIDSLNVSLSQDDMGIFILSKIEHEAVSRISLDLQLYYSTFQKLNERYKTHVKPEDNNNDGDYAKLVTEAF